MVGAEQVGGGDVGEHPRRKVRADQDHPVGVVAAERQRLHQQPRRGEDQVGDHAHQPGAGRGERPADFRENRRRQVPLFEVLGGPPGGGRAGCRRSHGGAQSGTRAGAHRPLQLGDAFGATTPGRGDQSDVLLAIDRSVGGPELHARQDSDMNRKRVVIAGLGDAGVWPRSGCPGTPTSSESPSSPRWSAARNSASGCPGPDDWARDYWIPFDRFRRLDRVRTVQATLTGVDLAARTVFGRGDDGETIAEEYDALVISTGVSNGFWRQPTLQSAAEVGADLQRRAQSTGRRRLGDRGGRRRGGSQQRRQHRNHVAGQADRPVLPRRARAGRAPPADLAADPRPAHRAWAWACTRAIAPCSRRASPATRSPASRSSGAPANPRLRPTPCCGRSGGCDPTPTGCRASCSTSSGFVRVTPELQVPGQRRVFAVGDVAATDPLRSSARNRGDALVAHNVRAELERPTAARLSGAGAAVGLDAWASSPTGWRFFCPPATRFGLPSWPVERVVMPWIVRWGMYRGVRENDPLG